MSFARRVGQPQMHRRRVLVLRGRISEAAKRLWDSDYIRKDEIDYRRA